jgi:glycosyltransferase involved in cell wall biosynthesis
MSGSHPLRVVIVSPNSLLTLRGSEQFVLETSKRFSEHPGVETEIVTFRRKYGIEDLSKLGPEEVRSRILTIHRALGPVLWSEFTWLSPRLFRSSRVFDRLNRLTEFVPPSMKLIRKLRKADKIYFVTWRPEDLLAFLPVAFLSGRKRVVAGVHSRMTIRRPERVLLSLWTHLGVLSAIHTVDSQSSALFGRLSARVFQIPNGVDCDLFRPGEKSRDEFAMLFAGSAHPAKGADLLPGICAEIKRQNVQGIKLWICTSETGLLGREIRNWSRGEPDVVYRGWVSQSELALLYRQASVLLMPSRREVQGLSNLEAQASGTPVIVSDISSFRETVKDGDTGFIVREFSDNAFAERVLQLHSLWLEGPLYEEMCKNARKNIVENFAAPEASEKLLGVLARTY